MDSQLVSILRPEAVPVTLISHLGSWILGPSEAQVTTGKYMITNWREYISHLKLWGNGASALPFVEMTCGMYMLVEPRVVSLKSIFFDYLFNMYLVEMGRNFF